MDECQNVIDFEELEKLCSSEKRLDDQENNLRISDIINADSVTKNKTQKLQKTDNNNLITNLNISNKENSRKETKETEVQTEEFDEKDLDNNCDEIDSIASEKDYNGIDNMVIFLLFL